ncbi:hypothetical protein [Corynebacterium wankanglinii]|uniref:Uncharacterized protein n=1 Tax=Corynebacterium wankanglinii TaxID=2735136 RepID=A0A838CGP8_9CORY|nr:hypothetical protein [Corynebacterium wankanglinii]MBA1834145.1 hypothetical protein [Corynebacterium wankanglinii]
MSSTTDHDLTGATLIVCLLTFAASVATLVMNLSEVRDPQRCPPDHVWVATGEIPQAGCMPLGTARELGAWP